MSADASAAFTSSLVRMRVARSDWWASRHVVSVRRVPLFARTAFAKASGPCSSKICLKPFAGAPSDTFFGGAGIFAAAPSDAGLAPSSTGWPLTARLAR